MICIETKYMLGNKHVRRTGGILDSKDRIVAEIIDDIRMVFQVVNKQSKKAKRETSITNPQLWAIKMIGDLSPIRVSDLDR
jgi:MarR family transcriptional regulator, organic hydroperoxide resistance regulator